MDYLRLTRPVNMVVVFFAVMVGGLLCGGEPTRTALAGISAVLVLAGGNAVNDALDREADKVSHPERPVVSGRVSPRQAGIFGAVLMTAGVAVSFYLGEFPALIAFGAAALLVIYSGVLSRLALIGNLTISFLSAVAVVFGAIAGGRMCPRAIWAGLIAGAIHLPREIFKDVQDYEGDLAAGRKTLPVVWGKKKASYFACALSAAAMLMIVLPYLAGVFGDYYISAAFVPFALCGIAAIFGGRGYPHTAQKYLKLAMAFGIAALFVEYLA